MGVEYFFPVALKIWQDEFPHAEIGRTKFKRKKGFARSILT